MTLFFPDVNVWLALAVQDHIHSEAAWGWLSGIRQEDRLVFVRFTQLGMLRLLTNSSVMGPQTLTLRQAWGVFDRWLEEPRVEVHAEPRGVDAAFRHATALPGANQASKWLADCYLLGHARASEAILVTFDRALIAFARKHGYAAVSPA